MHSRGNSVTEIGTYKHATYNDVVTEVIAELTKRIESAKHGGVPPANIAIGITHWCGIAVQLVWPQAAGQGSPDFFSELGIPPKKIRKRSRR